MRCSTVISLAGGLIALISAMTPTAALAQKDLGGRYFPLDHRIPGRATQWSAAIAPQPTEYIQPIRIELPSIGLVTFFDGAQANHILTQAPSQASVIVGKTYRIQISGMPEFPGVELYPSIELLDHLHPPPGQEQDFPIPIPFTIEEIETALEDRLVTKVIYLEQPRIAVPRAPDQTMHVSELPTTANLLQAADQRGRAMAIIRIGGRQPDLQNGRDPSFFGDLAPVLTQADDRLPRTGNLSSTNGLRPQSEAGMVRLGRRSTSASFTHQVVSRAQSFVE